MERYLHKKRMKGMFIVFIKLSPLSPLKQIHTFYICSESHTILQRFGPEYLYDRNGLNPWKDGKMRLVCTYCYWHTSTLKDLPIHRRCVGCDLQDYLNATA